MPAKLTQEFVEAWLSEHRPDFVPAPGWVYVNAVTPIPGRCRVCGAECAPLLNNMKNLGSGHCDACGKRATGEANRARGEAEMRLVAAERGYEVLSVGWITEKDSSKKAGFRERTWATLRCGCGNEWDVRQNGLCSHGSGCPDCSPGGYKTSKPGALYLLARSDGVEERGFGISNAWEQRTKSYEPFNWRLLDVVEFDDGQIPFDLESMIKRVVREIAGRSVAPDNYRYRNTEAFAEGKGIPMFDDVLSLISWAAARAGTREEAAA